MFDESEIESDARSLVANSVKGLTLIKCKPRWAST